MKKIKKLLGLLGEAKAAQFLIEKGFRIIEKNLQYPIGEIDIIAEKNSTLFFFEVKMRSSDKFGEGWEAVDKRKFQRIQKCAETYIELNNWDKDVQIAVISILRTRKTFQIKLFPV